VRVPVALLALLAAATAAAQAVTEWRTPGGLPVAVVEVAGGDVEHLAAVVPAGAEPPAAVAGWPLAATARPGAQVWSLRVPAAAAAQAAHDLASVLAASGCAAVAAFGPAPARDLAGALATLAGVPAPASLLPPCALADGRVESRRGSPEGVELWLAVPPPGEPRFETLPALAAVLERRLAAELPAARAAVERRDGCWRLVVRATAEAESPRAVLRRLHAALAALAAAGVGDADLAAVAPPLERAAARLLGDGALAAVTVAERLAQGARAAGALAAAVPSAAALGELMRETVVGRNGTAVLTEAERRTRPEEPETLPGGVILSARWTADEVGVLALAFGGVDPAAGRATATAIAAALGGAGWHADAREVGGVSTVVAVLPPEDAPEALEVLAAELAAPRAVAGGDLADDAAAALGLVGAPAAETLSVALALPPEADEGVEAARKFLGSLPSGGVRTSAASTGTRLRWTQDALAPRLAAIVELPATAAGWLAGEVLAARAAADETMRARWMSPAGGLAVVVFAEGRDHLPALDAGLAAAWPRLRVPTAEDELASAGRRVYATLFGDLREATVRAALRPFLPGIPAETELLAPDRAAVDAALAALPAWDALARVGRGPAPPPPPPVRKSPRS